MARRRFAFFWVWLASAIVFGTLLFPPGFIKTYHLMKTGSVVEGVITGTDCKHLSSVFYRFEAAGTSFDGLDRVGNDCHAYSQGQKTTVFFARENPAMNEIANPQKRFEDMLSLLVSTIILLPLAVAWRVTRLLRRLT